MICQNIENVNTDKATNNKTAHIHNYLRPSNRSTTSQPVEPNIEPTKALGFAAEGGNTQDALPTSCNPPAVAGITQPSNPP